MATTQLSFSYDATKADYHNNPFRLDIINFLVDNHVFTVQSFVATTIYFETEVEEPLTTWKNLIVTHFGKDFNFTLSIVPTLNNAGIVEPAYIVNSNEEYPFKFNDDVKKVLKEKIVELENQIKKLSSH